MACGGFHKQLSYYQLLKKESCSVAGQAIRDLRWIKWHWDQLLVVLLYFLPVFTQLLQIPSFIPIIQSCVELILIASFNKQRKNGNFNLVGHIRKPNTNYARCKILRGGEDSYCFLLRSSYGIDTDTSVSEEYTASVLRLLLLGKIFLDKQSLSFFFKFHLLWNPTVQYHVHKSLHWSLSWARWVRSTPFELQILLSHRCQSVDSFHIRFSDNICCIFHLCTSCTKN
jgi:hypothetical protein